MTNKTDMLNGTESAEKETTVASQQKAAREALLRLRKLGESLPQVDAVAVIREGRERTGRSDR